MPNVRTASELQRNINAIYDLCESTKEPVYITRNGKESLVVMDAQALMMPLTCNDVCLSTRCGFMMR
ncbi:MAG: type II toxin-antitoxin system Phd/YefM family antitoxin [Olsenella sp.]|jgi:PHD/YefM family antitoxin component YafN of YafNO toxin-antitoxin module|nr:type II toxin-antitoxin system Phd/YefM family antitoxin [Olsenella sp.]MCI1645889.1 type II toxin-antitoxin system Phd/YefM family antitoxin [Olsenella sp.]MCI1666996.1 type II toxin-antitoxin system Phd/YefM family antitoxin [Olsenella sp.]MCI1794140.1 type II toxin-antitoxin system Phd/YefM family antitoxin [Olsenella sp.]MCI1810733.1 type II toxin-antitoxin system Phd/YefM family antitoxin [Olsenella sp.]